MIESTKKCLRIAAVLMGLGLLLPAGPVGAHASKAAVPGHQHPHPEHHDTQKPQTDGKTSLLHQQHRASGSKLSKHQPAAEFVKELKPKLHELGLLIQIDMAFYDEYATKVVKGVDQQNFGTYSWRFYTDWRFYQSDKIGSFFFEFTFLGSPGLNFETTDGFSSRNIASISQLNGNIYPDPAALDEMLVKYISPSTRYVFGAGKTDLSNRFDTNRVANDAFSQFFAFALENNMAIPWPVFGGIGAFFRVNINENAYIMVAGANSVVNHGFQFGTEISNQSWYQMAELGVTVEIPFLGKGHYKLTPWHNRIAGADGGEGWGVGINFDQVLYFEHLVAFFRFGAGEPEATPINLFVSGGLTWLKPFNRKHDMAGLGVAFSRPTKAPNMFQSETLVEIFYRFAILPWLTLTPDLQVVHHPANDPAREVVFVPGIRLSASF